MPGSLLCISSAIPWTEVYRQTCTHKILHTNNLCSEKNAHRRNLCSPFFEEDFEGHAMLSSYACAHHLFRSDFFLLSKLVGTSTGFGLTQRKPFRRKFHKQRTQRGRRERGVCRVFSAHRCLLGGSCFFVRYTLCLPLFRGGFQRNARRPEKRRHLSFKDETLDRLRPNEVKADLPLSQQVAFAWPRAKQRERFLVWGRQRLAFFLATNPQQTFAQPCRESNVCGCGTRMDLSP